MIRLAFALCLAALSCAQEPQTLSGTLEYTPIEGGVWNLRSGDTLYDLHGDLGSPISGARVEVTGRVENGMVCGHMRGTIFQVSGILVRGGAGEDAGLEEPGAR